MVGFLYVCVVFGRFFDWAPVGICHARVGDGSTCSPDTVTCPKKNVAHGDFPLVRSASPSPTLLTIDDIIVINENIK